jgi:signal peptidase I
VTGGWVTGVMVGLAAAALAGCVLARHRWTLVRVRGHSMMPMYADGDRLLVARHRPGQVGTPLRVSVPVVFSIAGTRWHREPAVENLALLVKRVTAVAGEAVPREVAPAVGAGPGAVVPVGCLVVRGDNAVSLDSRHCGYVEEAQVVGTVIRVVARQHTGSASPGSTAGRRNSAVVSARSSPQLGNMSGEPEDVDR